MPPTPRDPTTPPPGPGPAAGPGSAAGDARPLAGIGTLSDAERRAAQVHERTTALQRGHWLLFRCERGHQMEFHRTTPPDPRCPPRCLQCGASAVMQTPEQVATREADEAAHPLAVLRQMADTLSEWAIAHLNAHAWTQRSADQRAARARTATPKEGQTPFYDAL